MKRKLSGVLPPETFKGQKIVPFPNEKVEPELDAYGRLGQLFRFRLRNGFFGQTIVPHREVDRLWDAIQQQSHFIFVFDSLKRRIALNLRQVVAAQFDGAGPSDRGLPEGIWIDDGESVDIVFSASVPVVSLSLLEDAMTIEQFDEASIDDNDLCQIANLFFHLDLAHENSAEVERLRDEDGAIVWLRLNEIALATVPLTLFAHPEPSRPSKATRK